MFIEDKKDKVFIPQTQNTITANDYNQIKNEIQGCISEAGLTPTKDKIQLPNALRTIAEASSTAAAEYAAQALASKNAAETAQSNAEQNATLAESAKEEAQQSADEAAAAAESAVSAHNQSDTSHADIRTALERKQDDEDFHPEDYGWPDIRPAARPNAIVLLAGVKADFSAYNNLGFAATCEGGYNVFIDGVQYGETYASGEQCSITWSQYSATTGFPVSYPEELITHIVQIVPATYGNTLSAYKGARVASSGNEVQGVLWAHFNIVNPINLNNGFSTYNTYRNFLLIAITAEGSILRVTGFSSLSGQSTDLWGESAILSYVPKFDLQCLSLSCVGTFNNRPAGNPDGDNGSFLSTCTLKNGIIINMAYMFTRQLSLKKIKLENCILKPSSLIYCFYNSVQSQLEEIPTIDYSDVSNMQNFITLASNLKDTFLDLSYAHHLTVLGIYGNSKNPINGLKQLLVSPQAPFDYASAPQINVSYTGLDQAALAALFKSLPYNVGYSVVGNPTIQNGVASGFSSSNYLTLSKGVDISQDFEWVFKIHTPASSDADQRIMAYNAGTLCSIYLSGSSQLLRWWISSDDNGAHTINSYIAMPADTDIFIKAVHQNGVYTLSYSTDGNIYTEVGSLSFTPEGTTASAYVDIGINHTSYYSPFLGSINFANSYMNVQGVPYFRGTEAMDKTINITGAAGAASLTAEQLAIATDKGWTVTR